MSANPKYKIIISGGGTGGHIFPAIAIADGLRDMGIAKEILFVGALGKMEMEKVPNAGYQIEGLEISGLQRSLSLQNLKFPLKVIKSLLKARKIIKNFQPDLAIGVGGYASGPLIFAAALSGVPTIIQEQNSYPGITNKILAKKAKNIFVAYPNMDQFFASDKIIYSGNPIRSAIIQNLPSREESCKYFGLDPSQPIILSFGGSLGAKTLNDSLELGINAFAEKGIQVIWQTGSYYYQNIHEKWGSQLPKGIKILEFLKEMQYAYAAADLIISRAGALSISELCIVGKPTILIPSPNVAEDHQTKNAMALVNKGAAVLVKDSEAREKLISTVFEILNQPLKMKELSEQIKTLGKPEATPTIVHAIQQILSKK
ncbi:MAG: undecaprenyldiphospho-muramoylpentapeptide beta-N-acetylglucosaminyltransferase [Chitinophagales bacterium]|nr:undecaprenyldiphospho-muramoylpentapeptide beta-N-acetylglucosaminyltransferase [Chitinophagales bacterium]